MYLCACWLLYTYARSRSVPHPPTTHHPLTTHDPTPTIHHPSPTTHCPSTTHHPPSTNHNPQPTTHHHHRSGHTTQEIRDLGMQGTSSELGHAMRIVGMGVKLPPFPSVDTCSGLIISGVVSGEPALQVLPLMHLDQTFV